MKLTVNNEDKPSQEYLVNRLNSHKELLRALLPLLRNQLSDLINEHEATDSYEGYNDINNLEYLIDRVEELLK